MTNILGSTDALMNITARPPVIFTRGKGSWLWDSSGKRYLDFVQGWAVNCLGHSPDTVADAISLQSRELLTPSPAYYNGRSVEFASALAASSCFDEVFFTNSGAEAVEGAIKLARKYGSLHRGGAFEIITFDGAFHGRTLAAMSASGKKIFEPLFNPKVPGFPKATLNDIDSVEALIGDNTVAVMLEPIQGESGVWPGTNAFLRDLRKLTQEKGLLLIVDEVQTGFGRTGALFHYQHAGITPDVMVLGKGIGGGVPLGALLARGSACCFEHGDQGGTFNGGALVCAVGLAVLKEVNAPDFLQMVADNGEFLADELRGLSLKHGLGEVRGRGLLVALSLGRPVGPSIVAAAFEAGLLLNAPRADCLRFMPALNVTRDEIIEMIERVDQLIGSVAE